ncbi:2-deoxy-scyllo-inosamine dehydrogenase [Phycisphaerae bacterium RAS1]|nr:2-deoxy-scyllo-inosamine dehydrogenase [Phycisphaerae bacterium RAS1]
MLALTVDEREPDRPRLRRDYPEPQPAPHEATLRVRLAGICSTDLELVRGYMGFCGVPGHEFVATVETGPPELVGRRVVAEINCVCRHCDMCRAALPTHCRRRTVVGISGRDGAFAERLVVPIENCHLVPDSVPDEQAVFVEPLAAALHVLREVALDAATRVTVLGPGRLGQLVARVMALTPARLTVVGRSERGLELCRTHGIHAVRADSAAPLANQDVVIDCSGSPDGLVLALRLVRPRGTIILKSTYAEPQPIDLAPLVIHEIRVVGSRCGPFDQALRLLEEKRVDPTDLISATFPLERAPEAFDAARDPQNMKIFIRPSGS